MQLKDLHEKIVSLEVQVDERNREIASANDVKHRELKV